MSRTRPRSRPEKRDGDAGSGPGSNKKLTWLIPVVLATISITLYFAVSPIRSSFDEAFTVLSSGDERRIRSFVEQFGGWGFAVVVGLMLLQTVLMFLPSLATMVVAVLAYGPWMGGLLAWGGMLVAASLGYGIGVAVGQPVVGALISADSEKKLEGYVQRYGAPGIIAARISPVLSTDAVSIVAGLVRMRYVKFIAATAIGTLPLAVLVAWLGADINRLWPGLAAVSVISLLVFVGYVIRDHRQRDA